MKKNIISFLLGFATLIGCSSCEPEELNKAPRELETNLTEYHIKEHIKGSYIEHLSAPATGKEEIVLTISDERISLKDNFDLLLSEHRVLVTKDCWMEVYINDTMKIRIADYVETQGFVVVSFWVNDVRIEDVGVYDKVKPEKM